MDSPDSDAHSGQTEAEGDHNQVRRAVRAAFPNEDVESIMDLLQLYGLQAYERERERVQLAIVKISKGDIDSLLEFISAAKRDYRDVLMWADSTAVTPVQAVEMITDIASMLEQSGDTSGAERLTEAAERIVAQSDDDGVT
jgi:hypothetical protein